MTIRTITHFDDHLCAEVLDELDQVYELGDWIFLLERFRYKSDDEYAKVLDVSRSRVWRRKSRLLALARDHLTAISHYEMASS